MPEFAAILVSRIESVSRMPDVRDSPAILISVPFRRCVQVYRIRGQRDLVERRVRGGDGGGRDPSPASFTVSPTMQSAGR